MTPQQKNKVVNYVGYMIIDSYSNAIVEDGKLPIYWLKKIAKERIVELGFGTIQRVKIMPH
jgi:hypothetical protein